MRCGANEIVFKTIRYKLMYQQHFQAQNNTQYCLQCCFSHLVSSENESQNFGPDCKRPQRPSGSNEILLTSIRDKLVDRQHLQDPGKSPYCLQCCSCRLVSMEIVIKKSGPDCKSPQRPAGSNETPLNRIGAKLRKRRTYEKPDNSPPLSSLLQTSFVLQTNSPPLSSLLQTSFVLQTNNRRAFQR
jgi:hypothetical protein